MKLVYQHEDAHLWYDHEYKILKAIWFGTVSFEAFANLVIRGAQILDAIDYGHIIFDRRQLNNFSPEARVWFKQEFMKKGGDGRRLIKKARKVAAIKGVSGLGQVASLVMGKLLTFFNPQLKYRVFKDDMIAEIWVRRLPRTADLQLPNEAITKKKGLYSWLFFRR